MTQEEKPFEIKQLHELRHEENGQAYFSILKADEYLLSANAEIRRLQEEVEELEETSKDKDEAIAGLNQQLADAPTWGKWVKAKKDMGDGKPGIYDFERNDGSTYIAVKLFDGYWGFSEKLDKDVDNQPIRFRRLNYEPKPAQEVEKEYGQNGYRLTLKQIADIDDSMSGELARDLLAAQARIKELEGKNETNNQK